MVSHGATSRLTVDEKPPGHMAGACTPGAQQAVSIMKKSRLAALCLTLAMALWAAQPAVLADEINWLTPGESAAEPAEEEQTIEGRSTEDETAWATPGEESAEGETSPEPEDSQWLDPSETREEEAPAPEEDDKWLDPGETPVEEEPEPEEDTKWLNPGETPVEEEPEPENAPEWLTPDQAQEAPTEPEPEPEDAPEWLTPDAAADAEEEPAPEAPKEDEEWLTQEKPDEPEEIKTEYPKPEELEPEELEQKKPIDPELEKGALIEVTVPASGDMVINPHRMPVKLDGKIIRDQLINTPQTMINRSDVPIIVTASLTVNGGETNGVTVTDHPISEDEREKLAYLYVEFQNLAEGETEPAWSEGYTGAGNQLLAMSGETVSGDVLRVEAGDEIPTLASYRIFGSLTENPEISWRNGDKLSVTVSFTFRPDENAGEKPETTEEPDEGKPEEPADPKPEETVTEPVETEPKPEAPETEPVETEPKPEEADPKPEEIVTKPEETDPEAPEEGEAPEDKAEAKPEENPAEEPKPDPAPEPPENPNQSEE